MSIDKEDLWLAIEMAEDDDAPDGAFWAMVADMLDCDIMDVFDAVAEFGHGPGEGGDEQARLQP